MPTNPLDELAIPPPPYPTRRFMATLAAAEVPSEGAQDAADLRAADHVEKAELEKAAQSAKVHQVEEDKKTAEALGYAPSSEAAPVTGLEKAAEAAVRELQADATTVKDAITAVPPIEHATPDIVAQDEKNKAAAIAAIEQTTAQNVQKISQLPKGWPVRTAEQVAGEALGEIAAGKTQPSKVKPDFQKERAAFSTELRASEITLKKLEEQGQGNSPQAQREIARIDSLGAQLDEITPREKTAAPAKKFTPLNLGGRLATPEEQEEAQDALKKNMAFGGKKVGLGDREVLVKTENGVTRTRDLGTPTDHNPVMSMEGTVSARPLPGGGVEQTSTNSKSTVVKVFDRKAREPQRTSAWRAPLPERTSKQVPTPHVSPAPVEVTPKVESAPTRIKHSMAADIEAAGGRLPKTSAPELAKEPNFDIEFKQPSRGGSSPESKQTLLNALNAYRDASEQFGEKDSRTIQAKERYRQLENPPAPSKRFNLLNNLRPPEVRVEIPPRPGMPGGPIPESLRQAVRQAESAKSRPEVGSERVAIPAENPRAKTTREQIKAQENSEPLGAEQDLDEIAGIKEMGEDHPPRWWERVGLNVESSAHDLLAWVASIRAKKAEGNLVGKEKKVRKLEKAAKDLADKHWLGALTSPALYSARTSWYRWREGKARAALERHQDSQERHENVRNEVLNIMANQFDTPLKTHEARAQAFAERSDRLDAELDDLDAALSAVNAKIAVEKNSAKREKLLSIRDAITESFEKKAEKREEVEVGLQRANARAIGLQRIKNQILKKATPVRAASVRKARQAIKTRQKTSLAGGRQGTIPRHEPKPGEEEQLKSFEQEAA